MTTWATLRSRVRVQLTDSTVPFTWSNTELLQYCGDAVRAYSQHFPLHGDATAVATATAGRYTVDAEWDVLRVSHVNEAGYEEFLEELIRGPGRAMHRNVEGWWLRGVTLYVEPTSLTDVYIYYTVQHTVPTTETDVLTVPTEDEELITSYILGLAYDRYVGRAGMLDRWRETGDRTKNPVLIVSENWRKKWDRQVAVRLSRRRIHLHVRGRDTPVPPTSNWWPP